MPDLFDSPASPLAFLLARDGKEPALTFLSGPPGAGKSTWCLGLAEEARARGLVVGGLISPAVLVDGRKTGIDLVNLVSGEGRRLAVRRSEAAEGFRTAQWVLDPGVLAWGNQQLQALAPCDILILDELGPLELEQGRGLAAGLELIQKRQMPLIVAVVRPGLLPIARQRWPWGRTLMMDRARVESGRG